MARDGHSAVQVPQPWQRAGSIQAEPPRPPTPATSERTAGMPKGQVRAQVRQPVHFAGSTTATTPPNCRLGRVRIVRARAAQALAWVMHFSMNLGEWAMA